MLDSLEKLKELEKQGYKYSGSSGFRYLTDGTQQFFVKLVQNGDEIELKFDRQEEIKVKKYLGV